MRTFPAFFDTAVNRLTPPVGLILTAALSYVAWQQPGNVLLVLMLPMLMSMVRWRAWPVLVAAVYFGTGNIELPTVIARFDPSIGTLSKYGGPALLTLLQALPFWLFRSDRNPIERALRMAGALLLLTLPGIGFLAWRNPLFVSGVLYPKLGLLGITLGLVLFSVLAARGLKWVKGNRTIAVLGLLCVLSAGLSMRNESMHPTPTHMRGWIGFDTKIQPASLQDRYALRDRVEGHDVREAWTAALHDKFDVVVLPESIFSPFKPVDEMLLAGIAHDAKKRGALLLVGETIDTTPGAWRNTVKAMGAVNGTIDESRLPMPMGNWKLFGGVSSRPFASDIVTLQTPRKKVNAAMSICFEDTVIWPHMGLLTGKADVLVSMVNAWATSNTRGAQMQTVSVTLLARLAGVPLVRAVNTWDEQQ